MGMAMRREKMISGERSVVSPTMSGPESPINLEELSRLGGTKEPDSSQSFVQEVIELFVHLAPQLYRTARDSFIAGDPQSVARAAHKLKSQGAYFGANRLVQVCRQLEQHGYANQLGRCERLLDDLEDELDRVVAALEPHRQAG
jgi:HPt (histidine-containing phosphotransfer) domain-containing protein